MLLSAEKQFVYSTAEAVEYNAYKEYALIKFKERRIYIKTAELKRM